jgi:hypothetical protein
VSDGLPRPRRRHGAGRCAVVPSTATPDLGHPDLGHMDACTCASYRPKDVQFCTERPGCGGTASALPLGR